MIRFIAFLLGGILLLVSCVPIERPVAVLENNEFEYITDFNVGDDESVVPYEDIPVLEPVLFPNPADVSFPYEILPLNSRGIFMYNFETDTVVFARNEHKQLPPASIAKIMTCLVILENIPDLSKNVLVTEAAFAPFDSGDPNMEDAAVAGIEVGQTNITFLDCIFGLMLPSGCEAANILAYNGGNGDMNVFVDMMNAKALEIGAVNTNFTNASGLYEDNFYTTAYDMFLITKYAMENYPFFMEIAGISTYIMPPNERFPNGYRIPNANEGFKTLLEYEYATGIKIGAIFEYFIGGVRLDGFLTLASFGEKDGLSYLIISLGADYYNDERRRSNFHYIDHYMLYEWAFSTFR
jgi:D-alanyl-D-alanine carboxypeptidase (penicillin-binding protein 5/6)